ncbi:MAG: hypothetical protein QM778_39135 [Myxococcales bacterium]
MKRILGALWLVACGDAELPRDDGSPHETVDSGLVDAADVDASWRTDAGGMDPDDAVNSRAMDASSHESMDTSAQASTDASSDGSVDASADASVATRSDASIDASADASTDAGPPEPEHPPQCPSSECTPDCAGKVLWTRVWTGAGVARPVTIAGGIGAGIAVVTIVNDDYVSPVQTSISRLDAEGEVVWQTPPQPGSFYLEGLIHHLMMDHHGQVQLYLLAPGGQHLQTYELNGELHRGQLFGTDEAYFTLVSSDGAGGFWLQRGDPFDPSVCTEGRYLQHVDDAGHWDPFLCTMGLYIHQLAPLPDGGLVAIGEIQKDNPIVPLVVDFGDGVRDIEGGSMFMAAWNSEREPQFVKLFGPPLDSGSAPALLSTNAAGDIWLAGSFPNGTDLGGGPLSIPNPWGDYKKAMLAARFNARGQHLASLALPDYVEVSSLQTGDSGEAVAVMVKHGHAGNEPSSELMFELAKVSPAGESVWQRELPDVDYDYYPGLALDQSGQSYLRTEDPGKETIRAFCP